MINITLLPFLAQVKICAKLVSSPPEELFSEQVCAIDYITDLVIIQNDQLSKARDELVRMQNELNHQSFLLGKERRAYTAHVAAIEQKHEDDEWYRKRRQHMFEDGKLSRP